MNVEYDPPSLATGEDGAVVEALGGHGETLSDQFIEQREGYLDIDMIRLFNGLSPRAKLNVVRILPFGIIWFLFDQVFFISDYSARGNFEDVSDTAVRVDLSILIFGSVTLQTDSECV